GTLGHLLMAELAARHGLDMTRVPYRSVPQAETELVAGRIQAMVAASGAVLGQERQGAARGLAVRTDSRFAPVPDLPTLREAGEPGEGAFGWIGLFAPPGTPAGRVSRLSAEAGKALDAPQTRRSLEAAGFEIVGSDAATLRALVAAEIARWGPLIERLGIRPES